MVSGPDPLTRCGLLTALLGALLVGSGVGEGSLAAQYVPVAKSDSKISIGAALYDAFKDKTHLLHPAINVEDWSAAGVDKSAAAPAGPPNDWMVFSTPSRTVRIPPCEGHISLVLEGNDAPFSITTKGAYGERHFNVVCDPHYSYPTTRPAGTALVMVIDLRGVDGTAVILIPQKTHEIAIKRKTGEQLSEFIFAFEHPNQYTFRPIFTPMLQFRSGPGPLDCRKQLLIQPTDNLIDRVVRDQGFSEDQTAQILQRNRSSLLILSDEQLYQRLLRADELELKQCADVDSAVRIALTVDLTPTDLTGWARSMAAGWETIYFTEVKSRPEARFDVTAFDSRGQFVWRANLFSSTAVFNRQDMLKEIYGMLRP
jgi:hypothetical protein